jgi:hypothetical protein
MADKTILVTGDCTIDQHVYEGGPNGSRTSIVSHQGGAILIHKLLEEVSKQAKGSAFSVSIGVNEKIRKNLPERFSLWKPQPKKDKPDKQVWTFERSLSSVIRTKGQMSTEMAANSASGEVLLINDAGLYFRSRANRHLWPESVRNAKTAEIRRVVLTMTSPLAHGDLWRELSGHFGKKLLTIVSLRDILKEEAGITVGLSWERTLEELSLELLHNGAINDLLKYGDLVVRIGTTGALWASNSDDGATSFTGVIDPSRLEDWSVAETDETSLCFAAAIATGLMKEENEAVLMGTYAGLATVRRLADFGYVQISDKPPSFPYQEVAASLLLAPSGLTVVSVPTERKKTGPSWSIMGGDVSDNLGIARRVALFGPRALGSIPYSVFGKMTVVDRNEIESLRGVRQIMKHYLNQERPERPLSIAVFGAPGSGKSFGVKQVGKEVLGPDCPILEFNLSQFAGAEELAGALHQVRDKVLEGTMPLVFWDEFDSRGYYWLQYLLAPMQDGKFQEGQITHPIGKCIFIFAGGTSYTMENFTPSKQNAEAAAKFKMVKGPDFVSRLNGFLNVLGPNHRQRFNEETQKWEDDQILPDTCYPIRRALLIRSVLKLGPNERLNIDQGVLTALLEIGSYHHGARSLETVANLTRRGGEALLRSNLPPKDQLSLHVDYESFMALVKRDLPFRMNAEGLAAAIHRNFLALSRRKGTKIEYDREFEELPPDIKASNVAAAARIPSVLGLAGLRLQTAPSGSVKPVREAQRVIEENIELLAEAEHNGWMEEKLKDGWSYGPLRHNDLKLHSSMVPYGKLKEEDREKDRDAVRNYPGIAANAGYSVVKTLAEPSAYNGVQRHGKGTVAKSTKRAPRKKR